jgi:hypothetical protein
MTNRLFIVALGLGLAACGRVGDLEPRTGQSLPQKPALASKPLTPDELLELPTLAKPRRVDELNKRGDVRKADRFDLPPADGVTVPPAPGSAEPTASTIGPDNQDEPHR